MRHRALALFLGSNIGNFEPADAEELLALLAAALRPGDGLLIGYDLKKDPSILELAYDDPTGVTAAFNKNLLGRVNRELGGDFDLDAFAFRARWNEERGAVESFVVSLREQRVRIASAGITVDFAEGDAIHTESSYKFTREEMRALAVRTRLRGEERVHRRRRALRALAADRRLALGGAAQRAHGRAERLDRGVDVGVGDDREAVVVDRRRLVGVAADVRQRVDGAVHRVDDDGRPDVLGHLFPAVGDGQPISSSSISTPWTSPTSNSVSRSER